MDTRNCPVCGGRWLNNQFYWATGKKGSELDLNALVCRRLTDDKASQCINSCKGMDGGVGWEERSRLVDLAMDGF